MFAIEKKQDANSKNYLKCYWETCSCELLAVQNLYKGTRSIQGSRAHTPIDVHGSNNSKTVLNRILTELNIGKIHPNKYHMIFLVGGQKIKSYKLICTQNKKTKSHIYMFFPGYFLGSS